MWYHTLACGDSIHPCKLHRGIIHTPISMILRVGTNGDATALARLCRVFGTVTCTRAPGLTDQELNSSTLPQLWLGGDGLEAGSHYFTTWAGPRGESNFTAFRLRFGHARWPHGRRPSLMPPIDGAVRCCDADHRRLSRHRLHPEYRHLLCRLFTIGLMPQCCALEFGADK